MGGIGEEIRKVALEILEHRPSYDILQALFPQHSTVTAQTMYDKWKRLW
jgi:hypothetical protein